MCIAASASGSANGLVADRTDVDEIVARALVEVNREAAG